MNHTSKFTACNAVHDQDVGILERPTASDKCHLDCPPITLLSTMIPIPHILHSQTTAVLALRCAATKGALPRSVIIERQFKFNFSLSRRLHNDHPLDATMSTV